MMRARNCRVRGSRGVAEHLLGRPLLEHHAAVEEARPGRRPAGRSPSRGWPCTMVMPWSFSSRIRASTSPTSSGSSARVTSSSSSSRGSLASARDDRHPLLLAAGEPVGVLAGLLGQPDPVAAAPGPAPRPRPRELAVHQPRRQRDVVQHGHVREQVVRLEDHADPAAHAVGVDPRVGDVLAVEPDRAVVDRLQQVDAAQQRRLARAGRADQRDHLVLGDVEVDARSTTWSPKRLTTPSQASTGPVRPPGRSAVTATRSPAAAGRARSVTQSASRIVGIASSTNSRPGHDVRREVERRGRVRSAPARTASTAPSTEIRPTSFCSATKSLSSGGVTRRTACGSTTCRIVCAVGQPERAGRGALARVHRLDAGPEHLGDVRRVGEHQRDRAEHDRRGRACPAAAARAARSRRGRAG